MSPIVTCLDCKQPKEHRGHGLCDTCYQRAKRIKGGCRLRCSRPGCPCFSALRSLEVCRGHITDELARLDDKEFDLRVAEMFAGQFTVVDECWEFGGTLHRGYGRITMRPDGIKRRIFVHHLVVQLRVGRTLDGFALHHCDNPPCFRPSHLYEGSLADNAADAVKRNRTARGDRNPRTKLTPEQIREIFARHEPGQTKWDPGNTLELAQEFGVDKATISSLTRNGHWSLPEAARADHKRQRAASLTLEQVQEIAERHQPGFTRWDRGNTAQLAQEFGVAKITITRVAQRRPRSLRGAV